MSVEYTEEQLNEIRRKRQRRNAIKPNSNEFFVLQEFIVNRSMDAIHLSNPSGNQQNSVSDSESISPISERNPDPKPEENLNLPSVAPFVEVIQPPTPGHHAIEPVVESKDSENDDLLNVRETINPTNHTNNHLPLPRTRTTYNTRSNSQKQSNDVILQ